MTQTSPLPAPLGRTIILIALALFGGYGFTRAGLGGRPVTLVGTLQTDLETLTAEDDGQITRVLVSEGSTVPGSRVLIEYETDQTVRRATLTDELLALKDGEPTLRDRCRLDLDHQKHLLLTAIEETERRLTRSERLAEVHRRTLAVWDGYLTGSTAEPANEVLAVDDIEARTRAEQQRGLAETALNEAEADHATASDRLARLIARRDALPTDPETHTEMIRLRKRIDRLENQLAALTNERKRTGSRNSGQIIELLVEPGRKVRAGDPLLTVAAKDRRYIEVPVPSRLAPRFTVGTEVELEFPSDGESRHGKIVEIPARAVPQTDPVVNIRIEPTGKLWPSVPYGSEVSVKMIVRE